MKRCGAAIRAGRANGCAVHEWKVGDVLVWNTLAITSAKRSAVTPNVPAVAETYPGFEGGTWYALWAPAGTPREAVNRVHAAVTRAMRLPEVRDKFLAQGAEPLSGTPQDAEAYTRSEVAKWGKVVKASGARVD